jgi:hypothetical protein
LDGADRRSYLDFVDQIDNLTDREVIWHPFTDTLVVARAPQGLSSLCFRDHDFWVTKMSLVHDMYVEEYHVEHMMRQFGLYQASLVLVAHTVDRPCTSKFIANIISFY